jgi:hypothetical protein
MWRCCWCSRTHVAGDVLIKVALEPAPEPATEDLPAPAFEGKPQFYA